MADKAAFERDLSHLPRKTVREIRRISRRFSSQRGWDRDSEELLGLFVHALAVSEKYRLGSKASDNRTRVLVGARIPTRIADAFRDQAKRQGVSMYRWAVNAFWEYYKLGEKNS